MLGRIGSLVARVAAEAGSVAGLRFGTEEPRYTSENVTHGLEIRNYGPRIAAETTVFGDEDKALRDGFRRLAGYIFGGASLLSRCRKRAHILPVGQAGCVRVA
jgi:hypothetical protein